MLTYVLGHLSVCTPPTAVVLTVQQRSNFKRNNEIDKMRIEAKAAGSTGQKNKERCELRLKKELGTTLPKPYDC